jgi:hypothetical protein
VTSVLLSNHLIFEGSDSVPPATGARVAWFSNGQRLLISTAKNLKEAYVVTAGQNQGFDIIQIKDLPGRAISIDSLEVSPDDKSVAMSVSVQCAEDQKVHKEIFTLDLESGQTTQLTSIPESARGCIPSIRYNHPVWSPDGQRVLFSFHSNAQSISPTQADLTAVFLSGAPGACSPLVLIAAQPAGNAVKPFGPGQALSRDDVLRMTSSPESYLVGCDQPLGWTQ